MSYADDLAKDRDKARARCGALAKCLRAIIEDHDSGLPLGPKVISPARQLLKQIDKEAAAAERLLAG